jgi:hypothetical protein
MDRVRRQGHAPAEEATALFHATRWVAWRIVECIGGNVATIAIPFRYHSEFMSGTWQNCVISASEMLAAFAPSRIEQSCGCIGKKEAHHRWARRGWLAWRLS